jgi:hypothetical protein
VALSTRLYHPDLGQVLPNVASLAMRSTVPPLVLPCTGCSEMGDAATTSPSAGMGARKSAINASPAGEYLGNREATSTAAAGTLVLCGAAAVLWKTRNPRCRKRGYSYWSGHELVSKYAWPFTLCADEAKSGGTTISYGTIKEAQPLQQQVGGTDVGCKPSSYPQVAMRMTAQLGDGSMLLSFSSWVNYDHEHSKEMWTDGRQIHGCLLLWMLCASPRTSRLHRFLLHLCRLTLFQPFTRKFVYLCTPAGPGHEGLPREHGCPRHHPRSLSGSQDMQRKYTAPAYCGEGPPGANTCCLSPASHTHPDDAGCRRLPSPNGVGGCAAIPGVGDEALRWMRALRRRRAIPLLFEEMKEEGSGGSVVSEAEDGGSRNQLCDGTGRLCVLSDVRTVLVQFMCFPSHHRHCGYTAHQQSSLLGMMVIAGRQLMRVETSCTGLWTPVQL